MENITQDVDTRYEEAETIFLRKADPKQSRIFFCHICRYPLFRYTGMKITSIIPGEDREGETIKAPFQILCKGMFKHPYGKCPAVYIIEGFVY